MGNVDECLFFVQLPPLVPHPKAVSRLTLVTAAENESPPTRLSKTSLDLRQEADTVYRPGRDAGTRGLGKGREQVREIDQIVGDRPFRRLALPTDDQRYFGSAVRYQSFASGNGTAQMRMGDVLRRSIVAGEQYDRFFAQLQFIELLE